MLLDFIVYGARPGDPPKRDAPSPAKPIDQSTRLATISAALLATMRESPGLNSTQLCKRVHARRPEGYRLLRELRDQGLASSTDGARRALHWRAAP